ncbi:hypothetical protein ACH5RR_008921, partial [Cinchona calisaya]
QPQKHHWKKSPGAIKTNFDVAVFRESSCCVAELIAARRALEFEDELHMSGFEFGGEARNIVTTLSAEGLIFQLLVRSWRILSCGLELSKLLA